MAYRSRGSRVRRSRRRNLRRSSMAQKIGYRM